MKGRQLVRVEAVEGDGAGRRWWGVVDRDRETVYLCANEADARALLTTEADLTPDETLWLDGDPVTLHVAREAERAYRRGVHQTAVMLGSLAAEVKRRSDLERAIALFEDIAATWRYEREDRPCPDLLHVITREVKQRL